MADETPTRTREDPSGTFSDRELTPRLTPLVTLANGAVGGELHIGDEDVTIGLLSADAWAALAAALDPATTATLFDQRDAAIERAKTLERQLADAREEEDGWMCAAHQREEETWKAIDERDQARAEVERMRPVLEAAQRWLEALKAKGWYGRGEEQPFSPLRTDLAAAVDVYNQTPATPKGDA